MLQDEVLHLFPEAMRDRWRKVAVWADRLQEIRLRAEAPITVLIDNKEWFVTQNGELMDRQPVGAESRPEELEAVLTYLCQYSLYAFADEIRQGFLTIQGGHRVGVAGQVILGEENRIRNMKYIRYLNIRIAHELKGVADPVMSYLYEKSQVLNTLLISPPGCGKTTMLRDIIRQISDGTEYGRGVNVSVVDERSEIAGSYLGIAQNDVGIRTDVLEANHIPYREMEKLEDAIGDLDVLYMTRVQRERFFNEEDYVRMKDFYILDKEKMSLAREDMLVLHPLPRVNEISVAVDKDPRACYFRQALNGKYMRMALILKLLEVEV